MDFDTPYGEFNDGLDDQYGDGYSDASEYDDFGIDALPENDVNDGEMDNLVTGEHYMSFIRDNYQAIASDPQQYVTAATIANPAIARFSDSYGLQNFNNEVPSDKTQGKLTDPSTQNSVNVVINTIQNKDLIAYKDYNYLKLIELLYNLQNIAASHMGMPTKTPVAQPQQVQPFQQAVQPYQAQAVQPAQPAQPAQPYQAQPYQAQAVQQAQPYQAQVAQPAQTVQSYQAQDDFLDF